MKSILVLAIVILFSSCLKTDVLDRMRFPGEDYHWDMPAYNFNVVDLNSKLEANIYINSDTFHFAPPKYSCSFYREITDTVTQKGFISIQTSDSFFLVNLSMTMILAPGTYSFGNDVNPGQEINASFVSKMKNYFSNPDILSGTLQIDTLSTKRIRGTFNVTCWNGTDSVEIKNAKFESDL